jgi:hypothetical protein
MYLSSESYTVANEIIGSYVFGGNCARVFRNQLSGHLWNFRKYWNIFDYIIQKVLYMFLSNVFFFRVMYSSEQKYKRVLISEINIIHELLIIDEAYSFNSVLIYCTLLFCLHICTWNEFIYGRNDLCLFAFIIFNIRFLFPLWKFKTAKFGFYVR